MDEKDDYILKSTEEFKSGSKADVGRGVPVATPFRELGSIPALMSDGQRVTFSFALGREVVSVHFDRVRREIFIRGHNIRNLALEGWHREALDQFREALEKDPVIKENFMDTFDSTLARILPARY